jgi:hypothetical protein
MKDRQRSCERREVGPGARDFGRTYVETYGALRDFGQEAFRELNRQIDRILDRVVINR